MEKRIPSLVLCVDDEPLGLRVRRMVLERAGYQVLTASNGSDALKIFAANSIDLVVLDYAMPGMNGGEVAHGMRQIKPYVPIILLSAYVDLGREVASIVDSYLIKGTGAVALLNTIARTLARHPGSLHHAGPVARDA